MILFYKADKARIADKIMDLGNISLASLSFAQIVSGQKPDAATVFSGVFLLGFCYIWAILLLNSKVRKKSRV